MMLTSRLKLMSAAFALGIAAAAVYMIVGTTHAFALHGGPIVQTGAWGGCCNAAQVGDSIPSGVNSPAAFKVWINDLLWGVSAYGTPGSAYNAYGASFIVETMLHGQINYGANDAVLTQARNDYGTWANIVDQYAATGRIQMNTFRTLPSGSLNSLHVCKQTNSYCWDRAIYQNNNYAGGGYDNHNFQFYNISSPEDSHLVIFTNPDGTTFQIRRECSNVIGSASPIRQLGWNLDGQTVGGGGSIFANQSVTFTSQIRNNGPAPADYGWDVRYCWDACSGAPGSGYASHNSNATGGQGAGGWVTKDTWTYSPNGSAAHTRICVWIAFSNATGPGTGVENGNMVCETILPLTPTCGSVNVPNGIDPTDSYNMSASVNIAGGSSGASFVDGASNFFITVKDATNATIYDNQNVQPTSITTNGANGVINVNPTLPPTNKAGNYTISFGITGSVSPITCPGSFRISYSPFFSVMEGDVSAGPGFGAACTASRSQIIGNNRGATDNYYGSGSQLGAFSLGSPLSTTAIAGFATNANRNAGAGTASSSSGASATVPSGLAFSNAGVSATVWGTTFGRDPADDPADNPNSCVPDYYTTARAGATTLSGAGTYLLNQAAMNSLTSGKTYYINGNLQTAGDGSGWLYLNGPGMPSRVTIVVNGDAWINSHIAYKPYSYVSGTTSVNSIPQFQLIVKGNIYIDRGVTALTGFYAAQPSGGTKGNIYTCSSNFKYLTDDVGDAAPNALQDGTNYYSHCSNQLTVFGSVAAKSIKLGRVHGHRKSVAGVPNDPAELFIYTPDLWMGNLNTTLSGPQPFDAMTSLPPIL